MERIAGEVASANVLLANGAWGGYRYGGRWPKQMTERFQQMVNDGATTAELAQVFHLSPNAVIGKRYRLGLHPLRAAQSLAERRMKKRKAMDRHNQRERESRARKRSNLTGNPWGLASVPPTPLISKPDNVKALRVGIEKLIWNGSRPANCRAIVTDDSERPTLYCGLPVWGSESYCAGHCQRFINRGLYNR